MASKGILSVAGIGLRAAGLKDDTTGLQFGGIYIPAHILNGKEYSARFETTCYLNRPDFTDDQGVVHKSDNLRIRIVAWNSRNAKPGKGLADIFAKGCSPGKEFHSILSLRHFLKRVWDNGQPVVNSQGQPIQVDGYNFVISGEFTWGNDANNQLAAEIASFDGVNPFSGRPQYWNVPNTQDNQTWLNQVLPARSAAIYAGEGTFGYARVQLPAGAQLVAVAGAPVAGAPAPVANVQAPVAAPGIVAPTAPVAGGFVQPQAGMMPAAPVAGVQPLTTGAPVAGLAPLTAGAGTMI